MKEFYTISKNETTEIIEKKSKFIADIYPVKNVEEAENKIKEIKKKYYDAKHHCIAYRIVEEDRIIEKSSDDGEPSGTAGAPMLNILQGSNLCNIIVIVTRYFGGILLGTGGLVRAYSDATKKAIQKSELLFQKDGFEIELETDYSNLENFKYYCKSNDINIINIDYSWGEIDFVSRPLQEMSLRCCEPEECDSASYDMDIEPDDIDISDTVTVIWGLED